MKLKETRILDAEGGWDNACGSLTLSALRGRMARNTIRFA